ncbi:dienelactone hydrolase family protein [Sphingobacterium cellulitidis]|uniref:Dienelactone hydrolase n=1 Tax=Sphingobacterium cellulitidis TaxID=1768011 RepID=A0A8H9KWG3_9SPHI|nr:MULTISPECIES: dienelactone hydrolase family protein [Sphingobacterium]MBA8986649.1 dienelactone hydrolase [Sphingobacterium soli]OYD41023.1 dienelactone hydrolase [Sphingobacterium cellulitidis]OYD44388.1 dienelactone hydrolase [Sphingobacterium cellulitidis]GGE27631.1 dienelactone hydrolase [Sphingobacterium soli]
MKNQSFIILLSILLSQTVLGQDLKEVNYKEGNQALKGLMSSNSGESLPGVLILPAWKGIDQEAIDAAKNLEKQGYIAFIADIYGVGNTPKDNSESSKLSSQYKKDYQSYQKRIQAGIDELKKAGATKVAVIGYCFGGTGALEAARGGLPVEGVVCIHGSLGKAADRANGEIKTKVLVEHPADDAGVKPEDYDALVKEFRDGKADWQIITYSDSKHTFTNPESADYNPVMAKRAWNHTLMFLQEILK